MARWLALYNDDNGNVRAAVVTPAFASDFPLDVRAEELGLANYNPGGGLALVEMPGCSFTPAVIDSGLNEEVGVQFIYL
ncbi:MAG: hypothetical protein ABIO86_17025 [Sphingomonas sp.]